MAAAGDAMAEMPWCAGTAEADELAALVAALPVDELPLTSTAGVPGQMAGRAAAGGGGDLGGTENLVCGFFAPQACAQPRGTSSRQAEQPAGGMPAHVESCQELGIDDLLDLPLMEELHPLAAETEKPHTSENDDKRPLVNVPEPRKKQKKGVAAVDAARRPPEPDLTTATNSSEPKKPRRPRGRPRKPKPAVPVLHYCSECSFSSDRKGNVRATQRARLFCCTLLKEVVFVPAGQEALHAAPHEPQALQVQPVRLRVIGQRGSQAPPEAAHRRV